MALYGNACKSPQIAQPTISNPKLEASSNSKSSKKEEKKNIDSLFLVFSLPVHVSHHKIFQQIEIADALITLLKEKKYKYLSTSQFETLFTTKLLEILPRNDLDGINTRIAKQNDKDYLLHLIQDAEPFAQQIDLSYMENDSTSTLISVKRSNLPNSRKSRQWTFEYKVAEPIGQLAFRILDSLTNN